MIYHYFFYLIYRFFKIIEGGLPLGTVGTRTNASIVIMSLLELLNIMSLFPQKIVREAIVLPFFGLVIINFIYFYLVKNYRKIILDFNNKSVSPLITNLIIFYIVLTIGFFAYTR